MGYGDQRYRHVILYDKNGNQISGYKQITRNDNGKLLNDCKSSYTPTTNIFLPF